ncbi:MAG: N-6 DNA methylase [Desulfoprunum sp.]|nr:N-6 DNA methylase [Desulfoprunum sp.]
MDECELWAILSLPGGVFSTAGAGVKTNLLFFTKGKKPEILWYYDLSSVKVGKKTPLSLAHFGFGKNGETLEDNLLPANLTAEWLEGEDNQGKFPVMHACCKPAAQPKAKVAIPGPLILPHVAPRPARKCSRSSMKPPVSRPRWLT